MRCLRSVSAACYNIDTSQLELARWIQSDTNVIDPMRYQSISSLPLCSTRSRRSRQLLTPFVCNAEQAHSSERCHRKPRSALRSYAVARNCGKRLLRSKDPSDMFHLEQFRGKKRTHIALLNVRCQCTRHSTRSPLTHPETLRYLLENSRRPLSNVQVSP